MNSFLKYVVSGIAGAVVTILVFGGIILVIISEEDRDRAIICSFPSIRQMVTEVCECRYSAQFGKTIDTEMGLGCNEIYFHDLVGSSHPKCP